MRFSSIDQFRGISISLMFVANFMVLFSKEPPILLNHAVSGAVLPFDLVAPFFGLAIGICLPLANPKKAPILRLLRRVACLFLIGYLPHFFYRVTTGTSFSTALTTTWGILETWALAYAAAFFLVRLRLWVRFSIALSLSLVYQVFLLNIPGVSRIVLLMAEGGPIAILSWTLICISGTAIGEFLFHYPRRVFVKRAILLGLSLLVTGLVLHTTIGQMDRSTSNASYTIFASGVSILVFLFFHVRKPYWATAFQQVGQYPLLAWVSQGLVYGPVCFILGTSYFEWPLGLSLALLTTVSLLVGTSLSVKSGLSLKV